MSNRTSRQIDTHWPMYQGQNVRTTGVNTREPSTNSAYPDITHNAYKLDPLHRDYDSTERQSRSQERRNQNASNKSDTRTPQTQSNTIWEQGNPLDGENCNKDHPHMPQHRARLPHPQVDNLENNASVSMAPIGTPSTSSGFGSSSTEAIATPQRPKGNRSPIRYPTLETDKVQGLPG